MHIISLTRSWYFWNVTSYNIKTNAYTSSLLANLFSLSLSSTSWKSFVNWLIFFFFFNLELSPFTSFYWLGIHPHNTHYCLCAILFHMCIEEHHSYKTQWSIISIHVSGQALPCWSHTSVQISATICYSCQIQSGHEHSPKILLVVLQPVTFLILQNQLS